MNRAVTSKSKMRNEGQQEGLCHSELLLYASFSSIDSRGRIVNKIYSSKNYRCLLFVCISKGFGETCRSVEKNSKRGGQTLNDSCNIAATRRVGWGCQCKRQHLITVSHHEHTITALSPTHILFDDLIDNDTGIIYLNSS